MRPRLHRTAVAVLAASASLLATAVLAGTAHADTTAPPYEPEPSAVGTITFYDASGNVVRSGPTDTAPFASYAVGSGAVRSGDVSAVIQFANPDPNSLIPLWHRDQVGAFTHYPLSSGPADVQTLSHSDPVVAGDPGDETVEDFRSNLASPSTAPGYLDTVQVRLITANPDGLQTTVYDTADIVIDPTTHTWTQVYPAAVTTTAPGVPTAVHGTAGNTTATVAWTAPANNGGSAITGYDIESSIDNGAHWSAAVKTTTTPSHAFTALTNAKPYVFRVAAINAIGIGDYSAKSATITPVADASSVAITAPASVRYNTAATLRAILRDTKTGKVLAKTSLGLYKRANASHAWALVKKVTTSTTGAASLAVKETGNAQFQWRYLATATHKAATSATKTVTATQVVAIARSAASVKHGRTVKIYGTVSPSGSGQRVILQQLVSHKWRTTSLRATLRTQTLPNHRRVVGYVFTVRLTKKGTFTYRVEKAATSTVATGFSGSTSVRAT